MQATLRARTASSCSRPGAFARTRPARSVVARAYEVGVMQDIKQQSTIKLGDKLPEGGSFMILDEGAAEPREVPVADVIKGKKVVIFGLPGAYTSVCSSKHVPQFNEKADDLFAKGIDEIVCLSVNDPWVMQQWGVSLSNDPKKVKMLADGEGTWHAQIGLLQHLPGLGIRARRYSMLVDDGKVVVLNIEEPGGKSYKNSGPSHMLADIEALEKGEHN